MIFMLILGFLFIAGPVFLISYFASKKRKRVGFWDKKFQLWAFGPDIDPSIPTNQLPILWNNLHPEFHVSPEENIKESSSKMIDLYESHLDKQDLV